MLPRIGGRAPPPTASSLSLSLLPSFPKVARGKSPFPLSFLPFSPRRRHPPCRRFGCDRRAPARSLTALGRFPNRHCPPIKPRRPPFLSLSHSPSLHRAIAVPSVSLSTTAVVACAGGAGAR
ncbi:hypothetical protein [Oryza sativa Japonica Group]|uniref:Uncharacterized protein n=1 Tax=Oryza sativa subsp. japonica TaxID=39947 RepID=Q5QNK4_ORYSJ|nr:hypothetical protein [Oryza sativa Japonica Group]